MPINPDIATTLSESNRRRKPLSPSQITQVATGTTPTAPTSAPTATATTPAGTVAASSGASGSQVAAANAAYHAQQQILQKYVYHQEAQSLIAKHVAFNEAGKPVALKVPVSVIGQDLHKAAQKIRNTSLDNSGLSPNQVEHVVNQNAQGKTVTHQRIDQMIKKTLAPAQHIGYHKTGGITNVQSIATPGNALSPHQTIVKALTGRVPRTDLTPAQVKSAAIATGLPSKRQLAPPVSRLTPGQSIVKSLTGIDPVSSQPGSLLNTAFNVAAIASLPVTGPWAAGKAASAASRVGEAAGNATRFAQAVKADPKFLLNAGVLGAKGTAVSAASTGLAAGGVAALESGVQHLLTGAEREVKGTAQAPGKVLVTTARTALGAPAATLAPLVDIGLSIREGSTAPLDALKKQTLDYVDQYGVLMGDNEKKGISVVQNQLGLVPALTGALGIRTLAKLGGRYRTEAPPEPGFGPGESGREARAGHKVGAQITSVMGSKARLLLHHELTSGKGRPLHHLYSELHTREVAPGVSEADVASTLGEQRLYGPNVTEGQVIRDMTNLRDSFKDPSTPIPGQLPRAARDKLGRKGVELTPTMHDRKVVDAIIANPSVVHSKPLNEYLTRLDAEVKTPRSAEANAAYLGTRTNEPLPAHYEPTNSPFARAHGIPLPSEVVPQELRDIIPSRRKGDAKAPGSYTVKAGRDASKELRSRANGLASDAKRLREEAANAATPAAAAGLHAKADAVEATATQIKSVVNRFKDAKKLEQQAARIDAGKATGDAAALRRQAVELRTKAEAADASHQAEFRRAVEGLATEGGYAPAIHSSHHSVTDATPWENSMSSPWARKATKTKRRSLALLEEGRVNRSAEAQLMSTMQERSILHMKEGDRRILTEHTFVGKPPEGGAATRFFSEHERDLMNSQGLVPPGGAWVSAGKELGAGIQSSKALNREYELAQTRASIQPKGHREIYAYANSKGVIDEHLAQRQDIGKGWQAMKKAGALQQIALIGDSPSWVLNQSAATPLVMMIDHPNPMDWIQGARERIAWYKNAPKTDRLAWRAENGAGGHGLADLNTAANNVGPKEVSRALKAVKLSLRSPPGRILSAVLKFPFKEGGPLIRGVGAYENNLRTLQSFMDADTLAGVNFKGNPRLRTKLMRYVEGVAHFHDSVYKHLDEIKGMSAVERRQYELDHPHLLANIEKRGSDAVGNWVSLTQNERKAASVTVFYNFLRFSLRWFNVVSTRDHPVRTAILANLSQSNADALQKILKATPSFFQTWGTIVVHPHGQPTTGLNLARIAPGSNAILEATAAVGQGTSPLAAAVAPFQPLIGVAATAAAGQQYGQPSSHSFGNLLLQGAASLSPVTRPLRWDLVNRSDLSQLYAAVQDRYTGTDYLKGIEGTLNPFSPQNSPIVPLSRDKAVANLDAIVAKAYPDGIVPVDQRPYLSKADQAAQDKLVAAQDKAKADLQRLYMHFGIHTQADEKQFKAQGQRRSDYYYKTHDIFGGKKPKNPPDTGAFSPFSTGKTFSPFSNGPNFDPFGGSSSANTKPKKPKPSQNFKNILGSIPAIGNSRQVAPTVQAAAKQHGVPASVLMAQLQQESNFNPAANSGQAGGESQFTPATAASYGVHFGTSPAALKSQLEGQAAYMGDLVKQNGGDVSAALNSYYGSSAPFTDQSGTGTYAQKVLSKASQFTALDTGKAASGPYVSPFAKSSFTQSRTDEGVDYAGQGTINAIGKARYLGQGQAWGPSSGGGGSGYGVVYKLLKGPKKGKNVFTYEGIAPAGPALSPGDTIRKGQPIASFVPGGSIETGYSDTSGAPLAQPTYSEGDVTKQGVRFQALLSKLGAASKPGQSGISGGTAGAVTSSPGATTLASSGAPVSPALQAAGNRFNAAAKRAGISPVRLLSMVQRISQGRGVKIGNLPAPVQAAASPTGTPTDSALAQLKRDYLTLSKSLSAPTQRS